MSFFPRVLSVFMVFTAALFMVVEDADARRFGGGKSFGRQSSSMDRTATPQRSATQPRNQTGQRSGASRLDFSSGFYVELCSACCVYGGAFHQRVMILLPPACRGNDSPCTPHLRFAPHPFGWARTPT